MASVLLLAASAIWLGRHDFGKAGNREISLATLRGFLFDPNKGVLEDIPIPLRQLDGQRVSVVGYMVPLDQAEQITESR